MPGWEYTKRDLNNATPRSDDIDLLNEVGRDGWELVTITANNLAYLKRPLETTAAPAEPPQRTATRRRTVTPRTPGAPTTPGS